MPIEAAMKLIDARGSALNENNPWANPSKRRDKLRSRLGFWKAIGCDKTVLSWIAYGKKLFFHDEPENLSFRNHSSCADHEDFIREESENSVEDGSFRIVDGSFVRVLNPTQVVPKAGGKLRFVHDTRHPNSKTARPIFCLSTITKDLRFVLRKGDLMFTTDLAKAYYSVPMHESAWPYLCFNSPLGILAPTVLIFGDGQAPFTFHKVTRPMTALAGILGIRCLSYLDDFLFAASPDKIPMTQSFARWLFPLLGWSTNDKCDWDPGFVKEFLGFSLDSNEFRIKTPLRKLDDLLSRITSLLESQHHCDMDELASFVGKLIALLPAVPGVSAWSRCLNSLVSSNRGQFAPLDQESVAELLFLRKHLPVWGPKGLPIQSSAVDVEVFADTGEVGYGGHLVDGTEHAGVLPPDLIGLSSTHRELYGLHRVTVRFKEKLRNKKVRFNMDSSSSVRNMYNQGGTIPELREAYKQWMTLCEEINMEACFNWLPRELNTRADRLSKRVPNRWKLNTVTVDILKAAFPDMTWDFPDLNQIKNHLTRAETLRLDTLLIHPVWPAAAWWNKVVSFGSKTVALPKADIAISSAKKNLPGPTPWKMQATLLVFS